MYDWIRWAVTGKTDWSEEQCEILREEYDELLKDDDQTYIFNLQKEIVCGEIELHQLAIIANHLNIERNDELIAILQDDPYNITLSFDNLETDLKRMVSIHKAKLTNLKIAKGKYDAYIANQPKHDTGSTYADWAGQLRILSKWMGIQINQRTLTVLDYTVYLNSFKSENKNVHSKTNT